MSCINKNTPGFKNIARVYGDAVAEAFVRGYSKNVKNLTDDFYFPSLSEIKAWLTTDKNKIVTNVERAMSIDPLMPESGIKGLLQGVVHTYEGTSFLTSGPINKTTYKQEVRDVIYTPNLMIMRELERRFPKIFKIRNTSNQYRKIIEITPLKEGEQILLFQKQGIETTQASPKTLTLVKDFISRIGVDIKTLQSIIINGRMYDANGVADIVHKLITVVEGKEATTLPEEAMHFAVEIIKQKNPTLYKQLLKEINNYKAYSMVVNDYASDPEYQIEGKPNIIKLKEEAIAKVLAENIISKTNELYEKPELMEKSLSWWEKIVDFIKSLFTQSGFDKAAIDIISGKMEGTVEDIRSTEVFQQKTTQQSLYDSLKETASRIEKVDEKYYIDGKLIKRRVSDIVKGWYEELTKSKALLKTEFEEAVNDLKTKTGSVGHSVFEYAFHNLVDDEGRMRETPLDDSDYTEKFPDFDVDFYTLLQNNLQQRLESLGGRTGTRFMAEITIYDKKRDVAGTIDLLAIKPDGKVNIYDWKFMDINLEKNEDVPWYKIQGWNRQMNQYKLIVQNAYNVSPQNFEHTRMIPIQAVYTPANYREKILPRLKQIVIGDVDVQKVDNPWLLPVGLETEKTGNEDIDKLLEKMNAIYQQMSNKKVLPSDKEAKAKQLNALFKAIRQLHIKRNIAPLVIQMQLLNIQADNIIRKFNELYEGKDPKTFTEREVNDFSRELREISDAVENYTALDAELESLFPEEENRTEEQKETYKSLVVAADKSRRMYLKINKVYNTFTADFVAGRENIKDYMSPEKIIRGISKWFVSTTGLQLKGIQVLYKKANRAFAYAGFDTETENKILLQLKEKYDEWAKARGLNNKNYFDIIKKQDKNELVDEYDREFYKQLKQKILERDFKWIRDNIDVEGYKEFLKDKLEKEITHIKEKPRVVPQNELIDWKQNNILPRDVTREIKDAERLLTISSPDSLGWLLENNIKKFPKRELWESKEWKILNKPENAPAKAFYDYIIERNKQYKEIGYITKARTFLPYVRKGMVEKLVMGGKIRLGEQFFRNISVDEGDVGFGQIDPLTSKPINRIPKYFTTELDEDVSTDLFRTMSIYNEAAIRYKYLSEIEDQIQALVDTEKNKQAILTSRFGKTDYKDGKFKFTNDNSDNVKLLEDIMKSIIYGQKFIESDSFDQLLFKIGTWGEKLNEKLGIDLFPNNLSDKQVSVNKIINQLNNMFQLNTLGLNLLSATSNLFGGTAQSIINAGKYFTKADYMSAEALLFMKHFNGEDQKLLLGALEYFLPLTENYNRELAKKLSLSNFSQENIQDGLMILMRQTDLNVQTCNFYAYLKNSVVIDGKVVNAREYVKALDEFKNMYAGTKAERETINERFEEAVKKLVDEKGVLKLGKIENNAFVIPGVERKSESVVELRRKVQQLSKDALGNLTEDDVRLINLNVYGKSFMIFKNWIPRLMDVRFGNLKYNVASDAYEWGRTRTVMRFLGKDLITSLQNLHGALVMNDKGVEFMKELYKKKADEYFRDTNKQLEMTEDEFISLVKDNVRKQMLDVLLVSTMWTLVAALKAYQPDDEEDESVRNQYRLLLRVFDKFKSELTYFYDLTSITGFVSNGIFPSISVIENLTKFIKNFLIENWAIYTDDEELEKKTKVVKYLMKSFPFTNQMVGYLPMFYPELAKDLGVKIQSNYGIK